MSDRDPLPDFADLLELAPEDAWTAFRAQLTLVNPGVVVCSRWELDYSFGDDFDVESPADMGRARVVAALNPQFWEILEDAHDVRCDRDEGEDDSCTEQKLLTSLTELGARPSPEETEAVSSIAWEIDGAGMSWAGSIELYPHPTDSQWIVVTSTYDRETWGDYLPIVLGLVRREFIGEGAALVIRETVGHYISRPNRISWGNLSPFDAVVIVSGLGRNEPSPLEGLDLTELHDWSDFCEGTHLRLTELELEIGEARRIKALESELTALFAESIARRRKLPEVPPLPKDRPIDALQGRDLEALKDWFDRSRAERLRQIEWKPQGIKYRTSTPILVLHFEGAVESVWVPFAGATNPPTVQDVLAKLPVTEHTPPQRAAGETDIGYAD